MTLTATSVQKVTISDGDRLRKLIDRLEPKLRKRFLSSVEQFKSARTLPQISRLLEAGQIEEALTFSDQIAGYFAGGVNEVFVAAGSNTATWLREGVGLTVDFDQVNQAAVNAMQSNRITLIREFTNDMRGSTRTALLDGVERGLNPIEQARNFRDAIGLTEKQQSAVQNYRRLLTEDPREALTRQLRDKRFDRTVRRAMGTKRDPVTGLRTPLTGAEGGEPLTKAQIDKMVSRYQERFVKYRSETIARTESLRVVHEGNDQMMQQAFDSGVLDPNDVEQRWSHSGLADGRDFHASMHGQKRPYGKPFLSGLGNLLRYPGDSSAPASETVACGCAVTTLIKKPKGDAQKAA